jgi:hypothetical protein
MAEPIELRRIGVMTPFDEARATLARWEKEYPETTHIALIVHDPESFEYQVTGAEHYPMSISEIAGIFYRAAQLAAD